MLHPEIFLVFPSHFAGYFAQLSLARSLGETKATFEPKEADMSDSNSNNQSGQGAHQQGQQDAQSGNNPKPQSDFGQNHQTWQQYQNGYDSQKQK